jgi:hypothetical protein
LIAASAFRISAAIMSEIDMLQEMRKSIELETLRDSNNNNTSDSNNRMSLTRSTSNTTLFAMEEVLQVSINVRLAALDAFCALIYFCLVRPDSNSSRLRGLRRRLHQILTLASMHWPRRCAHHPPRRPKRDQMAMLQHRPRPARSTFSFSTTCFVSRETQTVPQMSTCFE